MLTKLERKLKLWSILHDNNIPTCDNCQYWVKRPSIWCELYKEFPRGNPKIKLLKVKTDRRESEDYSPHHPRQTARITYFKIKIYEGNDENYDLNSHFICRKFK